MFSLMFSLLAPSGPRSKLSILIFHRVHAVRDDLFPSEPDAAGFDRLIGDLKSCFNILPLDIALAQLKAGTLPARAVCITFDDGYADNCRVAMPILQKHGATATFFIASSFLDGGLMFNDSVIEAVRRCKKPELDVSALGLGKYDLGSMDARRQAVDGLLGQVKYRPQDERQALVDAIAAQAEVALPRDLMMSSDEVRALRAGGMGIGAHTRTHPILARTDPDVARREIADGRAALEAIIGEPVTLFAYPNGKPGNDYLAEHVRMVEELGFAGAVSTAWGAADKHGDPFQLPRFTPWDRNFAKFQLRLLTNLRRRDYATV